MADLTINVLGGLVVKDRKDKTVILRSRKAEALLLYILFSEKESCEREELATMFWQDMPEEEALTNLRVTIATIKKVLDDLLLITRRRVSINPEKKIASDSLELCSVINEIFENDFSKTELSLSNTRKVAEKLSLYKGDFLQGFFIRNSIAFEDWASYKREILKTYFINSAQIVINNLYEYGEFSEGISLSNQLLYIDPFNDSGYQMLIKLLAADGKRELAKAAFEKYQKLLKDGLDIDPEQDIVDLVDQINKGEFIPKFPMKSGKLKANLPVPNNIPVQLSTFFGRNIELEQLRSHLRNPHVRLITLIGQGGIGKTRLAVEAARQNTHFFPDGVWFVPLEGVISSDLVLPEIFKQLKIIYPEKTKAIKTLVEFLNGHQILLVLDNFEQVLEAGGIIADVIHQTQNSKIIVTSREMTGQPEEVTMFIDGLDTISSEMLLNKKMMSSIKVEDISPAANLFIERAKRIKPNFESVIENVIIIEQICALVAGLPLGIELASTGINKFSLTDLRDNIANDISFLETDQPELPERQRSLISVFNAFWEQFSNEERLLMARLSVFRGAITQDAAKKVADASVFFLGSLVTRGLLQRMMPKGFGFHSMHRRYIFEKLVENQVEYDATQRKHSDFYYSLLKNIEQQIRDNPQNEILDEIEFEINNIRAALTFTINEKNEQRAMEFCEILMPFWKIRGYYQEGYHWLNQTFELETNANQVMKASALCAAAKLVSVLGDYSEAEEFSTRSLKIAKKIGDLHGVARALNSLGAAAIASGKIEKAWSYYNQSLEIYKNLRVEQAIAGTQVNMSILDIQSGKFDLAQNALDKALITFTNVGDTIGVIHVLANYARIDLIKGIYGNAKKHLVEALEKSWGLNARNELAVIFLLLSSFHQYRDELDLSVQLLSLINQLSHRYKITLTPYDQEVYEGIKGKLVKNISPDQYSINWEKGKEISESEIVKRYF